MKILHIVHYDSYPRTDHTFLGRAQNGLERWLDSMILNSDDAYEHYVLFFNYYDQSIAIRRLLKSGQNAEYTNFFDIEYTEPHLHEVFTKILAWFSPQLIHIHYLQDYTKILPRVLNEIGFDNIIATMHDESFLGENFGIDNQYVYDEDVKDFFARLKKVVFLHKVSMERYKEFYGAELSDDKVATIPNGITLENVAHINEPSRPFTVLFLGSFIENKGSKIIAELDEMARAEDAGLNLFLLGRSLDETLGQTDITYMGSYTQHNFAEKVALVNPDVIVIASIVEETFSYTALEATALGYPIVAFNVGALSTLVEENRGFVIIDKSAEALLKNIRELAHLKQRDPKEWQKVFDRVAQFPVLSEADMVTDYEKIYKKVGKKKETPIDTDAIFQQNLANAKNKEREYFEVAHAYLMHVLADEEREVAGQHSQNLGGKRKNMFTRGNEYIRKHGGFFKAVAELVAMIKLHGFKTVYRKAVHLDNEFNYLQWMVNHEHVYTAGEVDDITTKLTYQPTISIVMPVYNVGEAYLRACIDSIRTQSYANWELCIADDNSTEPHIKTVLTDYAQKDRRIKVVFREENGHISAATNSALELVTGEFVAFVDNDDIIVQDALLEVVKLLNEHPEADFIYSDEDKLDAEGLKRSEPFFKPDWSPDSLWSHMYVTHFTVYRTSIAKEIGGLRIGVEGSQDYDFVLRFIEKTDKIYHIPKILYHWRMIETSAASGSSNKGYAYSAAVRAKKDAIERRNLDAILELWPDVIATNIVYLPRKMDFVSIIILTEQIAADVAGCLKSIYQQSTWRGFEVILVDNKSDKLASSETFRALAKKYDNLRIVQEEMPFNVSKLNNAGAAVARGNILLFMNSDTEVITPDWLERMIGQAIQPQTGAVGAKLLYQNDTIQDAGIIIRGQEPTLAFNGLHDKELGYFGRAGLNYNYIAISDTALMVEKSIFNEVGGFDEAFVYGYNDVDFGMKLYDAGYYNVVRGDVKLYHFESKAWEYDEIAKEKVDKLQNEQELLLQKWNKYMLEDPFYNKNLSEDGQNFALKG